MVLVEGFVVLVAGLAVLGDLGAFDTVLAVETGMALGVGLAVVVVVVFGFPFVAPFAPPVGVTLFPLVADFSVDYPGVT